MRIVSVLGLAAVLAVLTAGDAHAQPGLAQPAPCGVYDPCGRQVQVTQEEYDLLQKGYISDGQHIGGGLVGTFFGLGLGHAVQGRWAENGWIFTLGEAGSMGLMIYGMVDCIEADYNSDYPGRSNDCSWGSIVVGAIGATVFRIWELVDVWAGPAQHNAKVRNLRYRLGLEQPPPARGWGFYAAPPKHGDGAVAGFTLRF